MPRELGPQALNVYEGGNAHNADTGINSVVRFWGDRYSAEDLGEIVSNLAGSPVSPTGFEYIYRTPPHLSKQEAVREEQEVATRALMNLLHLSNWKPDSVDCFSLGSGTPPVKDYAQTLANQIGMKNADSMNTYAACNSAGRALQRVLEDPKYHHKRVIVAGVEGMTRLMPNLDLKNADPFSLAVFGNGLAAINIIPEETLKYVVGNHMYSEDKDGNLAARTVYRMDEGSFNQKDGNTEMVRNPVPKDGVIYLNQIGTTKQFLRLGAEAVDDLLDKYNQKKEQGEIDDKPITAVIAHHPSGKLFEAVAERTARSMRKHGIAEVKPRWVVEEGNSSSANSLIAFSRELKNFKPDDRIMYLSYGAGMSATGMILDVGKNPQG